MSLPATRLVALGFAILGVLGPSCSSSRGEDGQPEAEIVEFDFREQADAEHLYPTDAEPDHRKSDADLVTAEDLPRWVDIRPEDVVPLSTVRFIKRPWFQWPTEKSVTLHAETVEDQKLHIEVHTHKKVYHFFSEPKTPEFQFMGIPLEQLKGYYHVVPLKIPESIHNATVIIRNAPGQMRKIQVPQAMDSFRMVVFGDVRSQHDKHQMVVDSILKDKPLMFLQTGDLVAAGSNLSLWEKYFEVESDLLASSYCFAVMGNHEWGGEDYMDTFFTSHNNYWNKRTYWADLGLVGLIVAEQYATDWSKPEPLAWLENALKTLQGKKWLMFSSHEPMFTNSNHDPWENGLEHIRPLLEKYGVDLVFSGHNHCYEHFKVNGIHYIVSGGGGAPLHSIGDIPASKMENVISYASMHHHVRLDVTPSAIDVTVIAAQDGSVFETFKLSSHD